MTLDECESEYPPRALAPGAQVVRAAPSPTGRPHIGTAMAALVNRAVADQSGGIFILRIEDTDRKRLDERAVEDILSALDWLHLMPDEGPHVGGAYGPYAQSERLPLYEAAAEWLLEQGHAYHCFCTPERLEAVRHSQSAAGQLPMYDRFCRRCDPEEAARRVNAGERAVIRMKVPPNTKIEFEDPLRGRIVFDSAQVDDQVLIKSDGFPTYHLAVVVDDHFMRVTTAVRGEEWISSTPKHLLLYRYFGWAPPRTVHMPLLRDESKRKLSKRTGDTSISWFRRQGYLPEGLLNFISRIIWAHPEEKDFYPYAEFVRLFRLEDVSKAAPVADHDILDHVNSLYMRELSPQQKYEAVLEMIAQNEAAEADVLAFEEVKKSGRETRQVSRQELARFAAAFRADPEFSRRVLTVEPERFKKLSDVMLQYSFFFPDLFAAPNSELLAKPLDDPWLATDVLRHYLERYDHSDPHEPWEAKVRQLAEEAGVKARALFMTIRVAVTGSEQTPPLYDILQVLGRTEVERRLGLAIEALQGTG